MAEHLDVRATQWVRKIRAAFKWAFGSRKVVESGPRQYARNVIEKMSGFMLATPPRIEIAAASFRSGRKLIYRYLSLSRSIDQFVQRSTRLIGSF